MRARLTGWWREGDGARTVAIAATSVLVVYLVVVPLIGNPLKLSATPVSYRLAPPTLGQDTKTVLSEIKIKMEGTV